VPDMCCQSLSFRDRQARFRSASPPISTPVRMTGALLSVFSIHVLEATATIESQRGRFVGASARPPTIFFDLTDYGEFAPGGIPSKSEVMETERRSSASTGSILPGSRSSSLVHGGSSKQRGSVAGANQRRVMSTSWWNGSKRATGRDAPYGQLGRAPVSVQAPVDLFGFRDPAAKPAVPGITSVGPEDVEHFCPLVGMGREPILRRL
jgi:hypothetical protein